MSEHVTDEMVEMAARIRHESGPGAPSWALASDRIRQDSCRRMRLALEAAAPLIAAQALEDARKALRSLADEWEQRADFNAGQGGEFWQGMVVKGRECASEARARADEIARADS